MISFYSKILLGNRFIGDTGNICKISLDAADFLLAMNWFKSFWSYKFKKMGLRYEIGLNIKTGDICWWNGPFPPGDMNDDMCFRDCLAMWLPPGECVETDKGYRASFPERVQCPPFEGPDRREMTQRVRNRHETVNRRMKRWNILKAAYRHNLYDHQAVFGAVACMTQLAFENGEPLFQVEYND